MSQGLASLLVKTLLEDARRTEDSRVRLAYDVGAAAAQAQCVAYLDARGMSDLAWDVRLLALARRQEND